MTKKLTKTQADTKLIDSMLGDRKKHLDQQTEQFCLAFLDNMQASYYGNKDKSHLLFGHLEQMVILVHELLPSLQSLIKEKYTYEEILESLSSQQKNNNILKQYEKDVANNVPQLISLIISLHDNKYLDSKFNIGFCSYDLNLLDIDKANFGVTHDTDKKTLDTLRFLMSSKCTDEGFIDKNGIFYYVDTSHDVTFSWLKSCGIDLSDSLRIANFDSAHGAITFSNSKVIKSALQLSNAQAKGLVTIYRILRHKYNKIMPLDDMLTRYSSELGFNATIKDEQTRQTAYENIKLISNHANRDEFNTTQMYQHAREALALGQSPLYSIFGIE